MNDLMRNHPDERPPWWESTLIKDLMRDHPDNRPPEERPHWWKTTSLEQPHFQKPSLHAAIPAAEMTGDSRSWSLRVSSCPFSCRFSQSLTKVIMPPKWGTSSSSTNSCVRAVSRSWNASASLESSDERSWRNSKEAADVVWMGLAFWVKAESWCCGESGRGRGGEIMWWMWGRLRSTDFHSFDLNTLTHTHTHTHWHTNHTLIAKLRTILTVTILRCLKRMVLRLDLKVENNELSERNGKIILRCGVHESLLSI